MRKKFYRQINITLTPEQECAIKSQAETEVTSVSELIRRVMTAYIQSEGTDSPSKVCQDVNQTIYQ